MINALASIEPEGRSVLSIAGADGTKGSSAAWLTDSLSTLMSALRRDPPGRQTSSIDGLVGACDELPDDERKIDMTPKKMKLLVRRPSFGAVAPTSYAVAVRDELLPAADEFVLSSVTSTVSGPKVYGGRTKQPDPRLAELLDPAWRRARDKDRTATGTSHLVVAWAVTPDDLIPVASFYSLAGTNLDPRERHAQALARDPDEVVAAFARAAGFPKGHDFAFTFPDQLAQLRGWLHLAARAAGHDPFDGRWWVLPSLTYPTDEHRDAQVATPRTLYPGDDLEALEALGATSLRVMGESWLFGRHVSQAVPVVDPPQVWSDGVAAPDDDTAFDVDPPVWREVPDMPLMRAATGRHGARPDEGPEGTIFARASTQAAASAWRTLAPCRGDDDLAEMASLCERARRRRSTLLDRSACVPTAPAKENGPDREMLAGCALLREQFDAMPEDV
ncbi:MAG TPA: hypothetical protein VF549_08455 [Solirubrobacteraceae bacterium]